MSINKAILIGNVGKDPVIRDAAGTKVAQFTLATTKKGYTLTNGTVVPDRTEWHNIVGWKGLAELAEKWIKKGSSLYVEGEIRTRSYDADGGKKYITEIVADNIQLLGKKPENQNQNTTQEEIEKEKEPINRSDPDFLKSDGGGVDDLPF